MDQSEKEPPDKVTMMDYEETFGKGDDWENSRKWADEMMRTITGLREDFILDQITLGDGQCYMTSVIQQLRRPEVNSCLSPKWQSLSRHLDPRGFKFQVKRFMNSNNHPKVQHIKDNIQNVTGMSWADYWSSKYMMKKTTWADHVFIQSSAWCLQMDIVIHQNLKSKPVETISGYIDNEKLLCSGPKLHLGYLIDKHFQSLLPKTSKESSNGNKDQISRPRKSTAKTDNKGNSDQKDKDSDRNIISKCPVCKKTFKVILRHIRQTVYCQQRLKNQEYQKMVDLSDMRKAEKNRERVAKSRMLNPVKSKEDTKKAVAKYRKENPEKIKEDRRISMAKSRQCKDEMDRLRRFREATMYGPIFVCVSCHIKCFKSNVQLFREEIIKKDEYVPVQNYVEDSNIVSLAETIYYKDGKQVGEALMEIGKPYICKTCVKYLKQGKIPPSSVKNSLTLNETDQELRQNGLVLTELEGALIAKTIVFQKIFALPKSRWTALTDKIINVPIRDEAVSSTLAQLPRTPAQAGLIGVRLKRKKEYKSSHLSQLINPEKLFNMLQKLKSSGNPFYLDFQSPANYRSSCKSIDVSGYNLIYGNDDLIEDIDAMNPEMNMVTDELIDSSSGSEGSEDGNESEDNENVKKKGNKKKSSSINKEEKGIKKDQFVYDEAVCMTDKYPEISVAPGEG